MPLPYSSTKFLGGACAQAVLMVCFAAAAVGQVPRFERDVLPIFAAHCFSCHGGTAMVGLDLRSATSIMRGSHQGPVVTKGSPEKSLLYQKVAARMMPPAAFNLNLTDAQIETVKKWIEAGAPSDETDTIAVKIKEQTAHFEKEALLVFQAHCFTCHGIEKPMAGLDLRTLESLLKGSANGPVISEGGSDKSILIRKVLNRSMPPRGAGEPLTEAQIEALRRWIDTSDFRLLIPPSQRETFTKAEAPEVTEKDRQFWSFRKPLAAPIPAVKSKARVRTPIDAFVLSKLEAKDLSFSPDASKSALIRRAYYDLIGLPPTPEEIQSFLADDKSSAYERLIDRLLTSPRYGERWGRHWLDAAGYTDVQGFDSTVSTVELFEGIWRYRDYVVRALNNDKPYDRFLTEQLAGDELVDWRSAKKYTPEILDSLVATGYLRCVWDRTDLDIVNLPGERTDVLFFLVDKVSTGVLGLTIGCARCHSHKYDPIPQRDYYRFLSIFSPAYNVFDWQQPKKRHLADISKAEEEEIARHNAEIDRPLVELKEQLAGLRRPYEERLLDKKLEALPEAIRAETKEALAVPKEKQDAVQKFLVKKFEKTLTITPEEVDKALSEADKATGARLEREIKTLNGYLRTFAKIQALWDVGPPPKMRLLQRGEILSPGPTVQPGFPTVLCPPGKSDLSRPPDTQGETSGFRLALARWLTSRDHPLTARVIVNRIWQHHFGKGIVETPENFGRMGAPPTNQELLDWLAVDFMEHGWSMKRLHKMILTSTVYRQSSRAPADDAKTPARTIDPENHLLWRMNLRRLEAEAVRDWVMAASGKLDRTFGGPASVAALIADGVKTVVDESGNKSAPTEDGKWRRSLYVMGRRFFPFGFMETFDVPVIQTNCTRRVNSVSPLQSLALINSWWRMLVIWPNGLSRCRRQWTPTPP